MIYVFLAEGFEEIEALAAVDLLRRAGLETHTVGVGAKTVTGAHGIPVVCDLTEDGLATRDAQMLVLPGGMPGTQNLERSAVVRSAIEQAAQNGQWLAAICAAPTILGHLGLLQGKRCTCFPGMEGELTGARLVEGLCVRDGRLITAKGPGAAIPFALKLVEVLAGEARANEIEESLQCR